MPSDNDPFITVLEDKEVLACKDCAVEVGKIHMATCPSYGGKAGTEPESGRIVISSEAKLWRGKVERRVRRSKLALEKERAVQRMREYEHHRATGGWSA